MSVDQDGLKANSAEPASPDLHKAAPSKRDKHLHQIDVIRLVTFAGVILDHCIAGTTAPTSVASNAVQTLLHYTRNSFFALTGFILTYQYRNKPLDAKAFWKRRFKYIGLPYLFWSVFYWAYLWILQPPGQTEPVSSALERLARGIAFGESWYHLYFVFVTMQVYVLFPAILWMLKKSWGYHRYILLVALAWHIWINRAIVVWPDFVTQFRIADRPVLMTLFIRIDATFLPYILFMLGGCMAALHFEGFSRFVRRYRPWIFVAAIAAMVAGVLWYLHKAIALFPWLRGAANLAPQQAANVFQLPTTFVFMVMILGLYALGTVWQERRTPGSMLSRFLLTASDRSFGIFLVHAFTIQLLAPIISDLRFRIYPPIMSISTFLVTVVITAAIVEVLRRTPISLMTTGREPIAWRKKSAPADAV